MKLKTRLAECLPSSQRWPSVSMAALASWLLSGDPPIKWDLGQHRIGSIRVRFCDPAGRWYVDTPVGLWWEVRGGVSIRRLDRGLHVLGCGDGFRWVDPQMFAMVRGKILSW